MQVIGINEIMRKFAQMTVNMVLEKIYFALLIDMMVYIQRTKWLPPYHTAYSQNYKSSRMLYATEMPTVNHTVNVTCISVRCLILTRFSLHYFPTETGGEQKKIVTFPRHSLLHVKHNKTSWSCTIFPIKIKRGWCFQTFPLLNKSARSKKNKILVSQHIHFMMWCSQQ